MQSTLQMYPNVSMYPNVISTAIDLGEVELESARFIATLRCGESWCAKVDIANWKLKEWGAESSWFCMVPDAPAYQDDPFDGSHQLFVGTGSRIRFPIVHTYITISFTCNLS